MYQNIEVAREGRLATVTVNRPEKLNALTRATIDELHTAFEELGADAEVGGVILTGAGEKAFVAGADIGELNDLGPVAAREHALRGQALCRIIETLGKPVVAAVQGFALGGGCELAMACTLRVAGEKAHFGQPEVKLGLIPGFGGTQRLGRLVGRGSALELLLTGEMIDAREAHRLGLVNRVVPQDQVMEEARKLLATILERGPLAVRYILEATHQGLEMPLEDGLRLEANLFAVTFATEDKVEGTRAFLEKRPPAFRGK
ncbi:MAG: enoyl-CoA hydratase [Acidobacteria bacterium]|nr:MAG: enoyl-CoA hydratase [Acidobacteriota bacterium]